MPFASLDKKALETGLQRALEPDVQQRAAHLGAKLRAERGADQRAADMVEAAAATSSAAA